MDREKMVQTGFRLPVTLLARIDGELAATTKEHPGLRLSRADVVVVDTPDAVLVTTRARAQELKSVVDAVRDRGLDDLL